MSKTRGHNMRRYCGHKEFLAERAQRKASMTMVELDHDEQMASLEASVQAGLADSESQENI